MKKRLFFLAAVATAGALNAQTTIRGKVIDDTGFEVIGAQVYLSSDMSIGTLTDIDGQFELKPSGAGTDTVVISYIGYNTEKIPVQLNDEIVSVGEIMLAEESIALEAAIVTATRVTNTDRAMQTLQRKSLNTVNAISSQAFSSRGDSDAASAVGRVTGVSVEGGKYVYIRGLSDRYSKSTLNGASIPGLDPNKNAVQMDLFPTNLIENIVVYKNFTPDLPADFAGGLVNVATKDFPDKFTIQVGASIGANTNVHFGDGYLTHDPVSGEGLAMAATNRAFDFDINRLEGGDNNNTVLTDEATLEYSRDVTLNKLNADLVPDEAKAAPNFGLSFSTGNRKEVFGKPLGFIAGFTYSRGFSGYNDGFQGRYKLTEQGASALNSLRALSDRSFTDEVLFGGLANVSMKLSTLSKIGLDLIHNRNGQKLTRYQEGDVPDANGDVYQARTLGYIQRQLTSVQFRGETAFSAEEDAWKVDYVLAATGTQMDQPDLRFINNFVDLDENGNPEKYFIEAAEDIPPTRFSRAMTESNLDGHVDVTKGIAFENRPTINIKGGAGYIRKHRDFDETTLRFANETKGNAADFNNFITQDNVIAGDNASGVYVRNFSEIGNSYESSMDIAHAYLMSELPLTSNFKTVFGLRTETTVLNFTSDDPTKNLVDAQLINKLDLLPSASFIFTTADELRNVRIGYARTLARPTFREVAPIAIYDELLNAIILGNQALKRTTIDNADLRLEAYSQEGDMISIGGFFKRFTNPIELTLSASSANIEYKYRNVDRAVVAGAELEFTKQLNMVLKGLSVGSNLTYVRSAVDIPEGELEAIRATNPDVKDTRPMYGQSPYIVNAFLNFAPDNGLKANVSYNVQGPRLNLVSRGGTPNVFEQPFHSLNAKLSYPLTSGLNLSASASNILNDRREFIQEYNDVDYEFQTYSVGTTFSLGLSWKLNN